MWSTWNGSPKARCGSAHGVGRPGASGGRKTAEFEVTELNRPDSFRFRNVTGPFALERRYRFNGAGTGARATTVEFDFEMAPKGAMRLLFPLLRPVIAKQVRANIARIPELVSGATSDAPGQT